MQRLVRPADRAVMALVQLLLLGDRDVREGARAGAGHQLQVHGHANSSAWVRCSHLKVRNTLDQLRRHETGWLPESGAAIDDTCNARPQRHKAS